MTSLRALALFLPLVTACLDTSDETLADTESELSAFDWGITRYNSHTSFSPAVATMNGVTYMVQTGNSTTAMYWSKRRGPYSWGTATIIPGQKTSGQASLAAFNGYLYMLHVGESDQSAVWFSRFDPTTETWTPNVKLSLKTHLGVPALAVFDGRLWIVGSTEVSEGLDQLWVSSMNTREEIAPQTPLRGRYLSTHVSLAVFANKLYLAYGLNGSLYTMTHSPGASALTWSASSPVKGGVGATTSQGWETSIAAAGGYLHLVHRRPGQSKTWWTYWNQCTWSSEVQFDQVDSRVQLSLTAGGPGLVLAREYEADSTYNVYTTEYTAPPAPITLPQCGGVIGT